MGIGKGVGVRNVLQQPGMNLWLAIIPMLYHLFTVV